MSPARFDRIIAALAVLACLSFVVGLRDTPWQEPLPRATSPAPPPEVSERDGELVVAVFGAAPVPKPIAAASVRVFWERAGRYYLTGSAETDDRGSARIERVARGALWVIAEAPGYARSSTRLVLEREPRLVRVELPVAHTLGVSVREEDGKPLARATVLVTSADPLPYGALTGPDGGARFTRLGPAPWTVKASAAGYESVTRAGISADQTLTLRRLGSFEVRVEMPDGSPAAGASVTLASAVLWPARRVDTDAGGKVTILGLLAGAYDVKASRGELVSETRFGVELGRGARQTVILRLHPGRMITALVTDGDEDNAPVVAEADVVLAEQGLGSFPLRGRTNQDGRVRLGPIAEGPAVLSARARDFVPRSAVPVPEGSSEPVRVALLKGAILSGKVTDSVGHPVDGASIEIVGSDRYGLPIAESPELSSFGRSHFEWALAGPAPLIPAGELGVMPGPVPPIPRPGMPSPAAVGGMPSALDGEPVPAEPAEPWVTRLDGTFRAHPVTPGRVRAIVRHPAYVEGWSDAVTLAPGAEATVNVVLYAGGALEGRVLDELRRPVGGARIDLVASKGTLERTTVSADDGSFAFAAVPSEVVLSVARPDENANVALRETVRVGEGERKRVELILPKQRDDVRVTVRDARGNAVDAAQVSVLSLDPNVPLRRTVFTSADGNANVSDAKGVALRVIVEAPGYAKTEQNLESAPETISIVLRRGVIVEGRITAVRGRRPVAGASVSVLVDGARKSALTNADGVYRVRDVTPGAVRVVVTHPDYASAEMKGTVETTTREDRPFELPAIDLEEPAEVSGTVSDTQGRPVVGARVAVGVAPAYLPAGSLPAGVAVTDTRGAFVLRGLRPGRVVLAAYAADVGRGEANIEVQSGRPLTGVQIRLAAAPSAEEPSTTGGVAVTLGERGTAPSVEVVVVQVADGSEAERAGLLEGDVLVSIDGRTVASMNDARARLGGPISSDVLLGVRRKDQPRTVRVLRESVRR